MRERGAYQADFTSAIFSSWTKFLVGTTGNHNQNLQKGRKVHCVAQRRVREGSQHRVACMQF